jgi:DNA-binding FrmR family transcriptional regulator
MAHVTTSKEKIVARVRRIAGQVAAIERSVTADADCAETLHLVAAVRGAVAGLMDELVEDHLHAHVAAPIWATPSGPPPPPSWPSCFAAISAEFPSRDPMLPKDPTVTAHSHDYLGHAHDENARRTRAVVWLSAGMMVAEIVAGYLTGSMALLADGFHMATHVGALGSPRSPIPMPRSMSPIPVTAGARARSANWRGSDRPWCWASCRWASPMDPSSGSAIRIRSRFAMPYWSRCWAWRQPDQRLDAGRWPRA